MGNLSFQSPQACNGCMGRKELPSRPSQGSSHNLGLTCYSQGTPNFRWLICNSLPRAFLILTLKVSCSGKPPSPQQTQMLTLWSKQRSRKTLFTMASALEDHTPHFFWSVEARRFSNWQHQATHRSSQLSVQRDVTAPRSTEKKGIEDTGPKFYPHVPSSPEAAKIGPWEMEMLGNWSHSQPQANCPGFNIFAWDGNIPPSSLIHMVQGQRCGELAKMLFSEIKRP